MWKPAFSFKAYGTTGIGARSSTPTSTRLRLNAGLWCGWSPPANGSAPISGRTIEPDHRSGSLAGIFPHDRGAT
jgi:hypothetical protein